VHSQFQNQKNKIAHMKEKILALLLAKFAGVRKDGLAQLATALSIQASDESEATAIVEKITADKVNDFVKDWRKDVDKEVSTSTKTYEQTLKEKFDLVEKKEAGSGKDQNPDKSTDIAAIVAAELAKVVTPLQQQLAAINGEKTTATRIVTLEEKLKDLPESFKNQKLKDFKRMNFETTEAFEEYISEVETDITGLKQELADKGLSGHQRPLMGGQNKDGVSSAVASFIEAKTDDKTLTGKEI